MEYPKTTKNVGQPCVICGQAADAQATIAALQARVQELEAEGVKLFEWRLALHSLTPGGSEFCTPNACEEWVRKHRASQHEYLIEQIKQRKDLQSQLTQRTAEFQRHDGELQQICGQELGYPWFKDDQKNFPGATEKDGVCVGEHVGITIAQELANAYRKRTAELEAAKQNLERRTDECNEISKMYVEAQAELERVRGLIKALPKVEGEIYEAVASYRYDKAPEAWFHCESQLIALLKHRQGMEGV